MRTPAGNKMRSAGQPGEYDLFVSYAHSDVRDQGGAFLDGFLQLLREEHRRFAPDDLHIFFDRDSIRTMEDWEQRILRGLRSSTILVAVLAPGYLASPWCRREWTAWLKHEHEQGRPESAAPLYAVTAPPLEAATPDPEDAFLTGIARRQRLDLRSWWQEGAAGLKSPELRHRIALFEQQMAEGLDRARREEQAPTTVPPHNPRFVGRAAALREVREKLALGVVGAVVAVHGLPGSGKSALVFEYAHLFAADYPGGRFLVRCSGQTDLRLALVTIAPDLGITLQQEELVDLDRGVARIRASFAGRPRTLLVLDNVDSLDVLAAAAREEVLPRGDRLHVLATTRLDPFALAASPMAPVELDGLLEDEGVELMRRYRPFQGPDDERAARAIVGRVGSHALAVEMMAVCLWQQEGAGVTYPGYLGRLEEQGLRALEPEASDDPIVLSRHATVPLPALLGATLDGLTAEERWALELAALLPPDVVAFPWIETLCKARFPALATVREGYPDPWSRVQRRVAGLRLLTGSRDARLARLHRVVKEVVASRAFPDDARQQHADLLRHANDRAKLLYDSWFRPELRWEIEPLRLFVLDELAGRPSEDLLRIANRVNGPLLRLARYRDALRLSELALAVGRKILPGERPLRPTLMSNLATVRIHLADYDGARALIEEAIGELENWRRPHLKTLSVLLTNLGHLEWSCARPEAARQASGRALDIARERCVEDVDQAGILSNLAVVDRVLGDSHSARSRLLEALAIQERLLATNHPDLARTLQNLSNVARDLDDLPAARDFLLRAIHIDELALAADHPERAARLMNLGLLEDQMNDNPAAFEHLTNALAVFERAFGPAHPQVAIALENLAAPNVKLGKVEEARTYLLRSIAIQAALPMTAAGGAAGDALAGTYFKLGLLEQGRQAWREAEAALRSGISLIEAKDPEDSRLALPHWSLASVLAATGNLAGARDSWARALRIEEKAGDREKVAETSWSLAQAELGLADPVAARTHIQRMVTIRESLLRDERGDQEALLADGHMMLAALDRQAGRLADAMTSATRALALLRQLVARTGALADYTRLMSCLVAVSGLQEEAGDGPGGRALQRESDEIAARLMGGMPGAGRVDAPPAPAQRPRTRKPKAGPKAAATTRKGRGPRAAPK